MSDVLARIHLPATIDDCHQHLSIAAPSDADLAERRAMMAEHHIRSAVLMPSFDYDTSRGTAGTMAALDTLTAYRARAPELFPWMGCSVEPSHGGAAVRLLDELLDTGRWDLVTWHNRYHGIPADAPVMHRLVEVAEAHTTPIFLHAAGNLDHEEAWRVARLVRAHAQATFVILDGLLHHAAAEQLAALAAETGNVYLDTANALPVARIVERVAAVAGWQRLLFGSGWYNAAHSWDACTPLLALSAMPLDAAVRESLFGGALRRLLTREPAQP